jgi:nucleotide-binding universal stress UspA family protein
LLRRGAEPPFRSLSGQKVLVLLDGSALAETALPIALELARVLDTELILFKAVGVYSVPYAVPTELMTLPDLDVQLAWDASFDVKEAEAYLSLVSERLRSQSPDTAVHTQVQVGDLVEQVGAFESASDIVLIVMATHHRSALAEALRGSAVHDIVRATACPLEVVHPSAACRLTRMV